MDCRRTVLLAVALTTACAGCWPSNGRQWLRPKTPAPPKIGRPETTVSNSIPMTETNKRLLAFRKPKTKRPNPQTYVKWAEVRETAAAEAKDKPAQRQAYWDEARKGYQLALKIDAKHIPALTGLGRVYSYLGERERATATFTAALGEAPKNAHLWYEFGMAYARFKSWPQAIQSMEKAVQFDPENRHYRKWLGLCLTRAGRVDEGVVVLSRVMGAKLAHYNAAGLLAQMGQVEESRRQLQAALQLDPQFARAQNMLANLPTNQTGPIQPVVHFEPTP